MRQWLVGLLALVTTSCGSLSAPMVAYTGRETLSAVSGTAPSQVIVRFKAGADSQAVGKFLRTQGARTLSQNSRRGVSLLSVSGDPQASVSRFQQSGLVEYAEPNYRVKKAFTPNDPRTGGPGGQYGLKLINADRAWDLTLGDPRVVVAVIDTGVDLGHPDLRRKLVPGYNVLTKGAEPPLDDNGHGTHVAGIIGADTDNREGIAGTAPMCRLMPIKALDRQGDGYTYDIAEGIYWAVDHGARVINLSLGGRGASQSLREAVEYAQAKGVVLIAAMGNGDEYGIRQNWPTFPASYPGVIGVGAVGRGRMVTDFSNYGSWISVVAPGDGILSTMPTYPVHQTTSEGYQQGYDSMPGTSMAAPMVAGVAALMLSRYPRLTPAQVKAKLESTAQPLGEGGFSADYGYGLVDAARAVM